MRKASRIIGLIIISIIAIFYLFIIVAGFFEREPISFDFESLGMVFLCFLTITSVVLAWIKVRIGVWVVFCVGILFSIFALVTAGSHHLLAAMSSGGPLVIGAILILLGLDRNKRDSK